MKIEEIFDGIAKYKEIHILTEALKLHVFKWYEDSHSCEFLASESGINVRKSSLLLDALTAMGLLRKKESLYRNSEMAEKYLNPTKGGYLGDYILYWINKEGFSSLKELLYERESIPQPDTTYAFADLAEISANEIHQKRAPPFLEDLDRLGFENKNFRVLDLGGGSGMLSIDLLLGFSGAEAVVFDQPSIIHLPQKLAEKYGVEKRLNTIGGDFLRDPLGENYDVIVASGIMDFAAGQLDNFIKKIYRTLNKKGYLYLVTCDFNSTFTAPKRAVINWLPGRLKNANLLVAQKELERIILANHFVFIAERRIQTFTQSFLSQIYKMEEMHNE